MLLQFKFKNHKCFYEEATLDLSATQEKRYLDNTLDACGVKVLPLVEIHGANASGKSTVLDALKYFSVMVKNSISLDVTKNITRFPFAFSHKTQKENSDYEVSFIINNEEYRYGFSVNEEEFAEEWLYKRKVSKNNQTIQKIIFERYDNKVIFGASYKTYEKSWEVFGKNSLFNSKKILVLSSLAMKEENGILRDIFDYISKFTFIENNELSIKVLNENNNLYKKFEEILNEFDPCLLGINIKEEKDLMGKKIYKIHGMHQSIEGNEVLMIPLKFESEGTIKIFNIMPTILLNLDKGGVLCIDELDTKFHPLLFKKIVNLYKDKSINRHNAQLIYTAHSTFLFNSEDLRRDELYLTDKDNLGKSQLYSLSDFRNLRSDSDYEKKYLTGQFGAIPYEEK